MPNATQPARLTAAINHVRVRRLPRTSKYARQPETRKQIEPRASGVQTSRLYSVASRPAWSAWNVLMLKKNVPMSCTALLHQSSDRGRKKPLSTYCSAAAEVKKIDP